MTQLEYLDTLIGGTHDGERRPLADRHGPGVRVPRKLDLRSILKMTDDEPADPSYALESYTWRHFWLAGRSYRALVWDGFSEELARQYFARELIDRGLAGIDPAIAAPTAWRKRERRPHILQSSIKCDRLQDGRRAWTVTACDQWGQEITTKTSVENFREIRDEFDATVDAFKAAEAQLEHDRRQLHSQRAEK